jgi:hypothetical protein
MDSHERPPYEAPKLEVIGSLHELTETGGGSWCFHGTTIGPPDYWAIIPISNCSR